MLVSCLGYSVRLEEIPSRSEAKGLANRTGAELIGDDYQAFRYVRIRDVSGRTSLDIVLCLSIQGANPHILLRTHAPHLVAGFDRDVVGFDLHSGSKLYEMQLSSPVQEFIQVPEESGTLVLTELGPLLVSSEGEQKWGYMDDIVEDYELDEDVLTLRFDGGRLVRLNVRNGVPYV